MADIRTKDQALILPFSDAADNLKHRIPRVAHREQYIQILNEGGVFQVGQFCFLDRAFRLKYREIPEDPDPGPDPGPRCPVTNSIVYVQVVESVAPSEQITYQNRYMIRDNAWPVAQFMDEFNAWRTHLEGLTQDRLQIHPDGASTGTGLMGSSRSNTYWYASIPTIKTHDCRWTRTIKPGSGGFGSVLGAASADLSLFVRRIGNPVSTTRWEITASRKIFPSFEWTIRSVHVYEPPEIALTSTGGITITGGVNETVPIGQTKHHQTHASIGSIEEFFGSLAAPDEIRSHEQKTVRVRKQSSTWTMAATFDVPS